MTSKYLNPIRIFHAIAWRAEALSKNIARRRRQISARERLRSLKNQPLPIKVNIGCGHEPFQGWINVDLDPAVPADLQWDVTDGLPFDSDSCSLIYCEHFLEHLPVQEGVCFLSECYRSLSTGGVVRIAMPSLQETVRCYHEGDWHKQTWLVTHGFTFIQTRAEYINIAFREWGHQWLYDLEELDRRLREAGFSHVESVSWGGSRHLDLANRETRAETMLICEATK